MLNRKPISLTRRRRAAHMPIERVLRYRNPDVVRAFLRVYDLDRREAQVLFRDVLRLLWLKAQYDPSRVPSLRKPSGIPIFKFQLLLDQMWHAFILHTREYAAFCEQYLGRFIHHDPTFRPRRPPKRPSAATANRVFDLVHDQLGEEVAIRWFGDHLERYTPEFADEIRRRHAAAPEATVAPPA